MKEKKVYVVCKGFWSEDHIGNDVIGVFEDHSDAIACMNDVSSRELDEITDSSDEYEEGEFNYDWVEGKFGIHEVYYEVKQTCYIQKGAKK